MKVLVTGAGGYIGQALLKRLCIADYEAVGIDSGFRENWVKSLGGQSLTNWQKKPFLFCNVAMTHEVQNILQYFRPECIIHLASQPSGPFSEVTLKHRVETQTNNLTMLLNLLGVSKELGLDPKFIVTTTTGVPGAPDKPIEEAHSPNLAGSAYHVSRGFDSANLYLAARQWNQRILELRTSIVYGTRIKNSLCPDTRFDWDFWFGTALHRFILRKKLGLPIMVYGKGEQKKPFISLSDIVESLISSTEHDIQPGHEIMNQTTELVSIMDLAKRVGGNVKNIPNPRVENESHNMQMENKKFLTLLNRDCSNMTEEIKIIEKDINLKLLPANWESVFNGQIQITQQAA